MVSGSLYLPQLRSKQVRRVIDPADQYVILLTFQVMSLKNQESSFLSPPYLPHRAVVGLLNGRIDLLLSGLYDRVGDQLLPGTRRWIRGKTRECGDCHGYDSLGCRLQS